jgi:hypothetical protein
MSDTVKGVEGERYGKEQLGRSLGPSWKIVDELDQICGLESGEVAVEKVGKGAGVECDRKGGTSDSVRNGRKPGDLEHQHRSLAGPRSTTYLRLVDGEVRRIRSLFALSVKYRHTFHRGDWRCLRCREKPSCSGELSRDDAWSRQAEAWC